MPDAAGKFYFQDFVIELKARGFDGFLDADLKVFVNRGYFHVARKNRWTWEQTSDAFTMAPGTTYIDLSTAATDLTNFRSLDKLYVTTAGKQKKLRPLSDDEFLERWLTLDLTASANRGEPFGYYVWQHRLYVVPPPVVARDFMAYYHRRVTALLADLDQPLTPQDLDEAIVEASLIRAHTRANEPQLAQLSRQDLEEYFDDMRDEEEHDMEEQPSRMLPDNTWL